MLSPKNKAYPNDLKMLLSKDFKNPVFALSVLCSFLIVIYAFFQIYPFFSSSLVPDEIWFNTLSVNHVELLKKHGLLYFITNQENELGYGSLYWIANAILIFIFKPASTALPMKTAAYICAVIIPCV